MVFSAILIAAMLEEEDVTRTSLFILESLLFSLMMGSSAARRVW
jgi:hypothetical protein